MGFLDKLRLTNIMRQNPAEERPWGMPDLFSSNVQQQSRPAGVTITNERPYVPYINPRFAQPTPKKNVVYGGTEGFTPMQQRFQQQDDIKQQMDFRNQQLTDNFLRQQEMARTKRDDSEFMFNKELGAKRDLENLELDKALKIEGTKAKTAAELARAQAGFRQNEVVAREAERGRQNRMTQAEKPITEKPDRPLDEARDLNNKMQQLVLKHPQVGPYITKDEATGQMRISEDASPEQIAWIQKQLNMGQASPDSGTPGQPIRQRNKKTGAIRESTDGGKTWKEVK